MGFSNQFFKVLGIVRGDRGSLQSFAKKSGLSVSRLRYYNDNNILPTGLDLEAVLRTTGIDTVELQIAMGRLDSKLLGLVASAADLIRSKASAESSHLAVPKPELVFETDLGRLYKGDCLSLLGTMDSDSVDFVFADPPFNLNKLYPSNIDDDLKSEKYIQWCQEWIYQSARILKQGGSLFLWNLPRWNATLAEYTNGILTFRHWISVDIKYSLPIQKRLYPSHYSLLYYVKGAKPNTFHPDRLPMSVCPKCFADLKDYGGYKNKMNPKGVNLTDVWTDIPPVRHAKYKRRPGANELSLKLLDRIIELSTNENDVIFDPFGGSGTTYMAAELKSRRWIGVELGPAEDIIERFRVIEQEREILNNYRKNYNALFSDELRDRRNQLSLWTCESVGSVEE